MAYKKFLLVLQQYMLLKNDMYLRKVASSTFLLAWVRFVCLLGALLIGCKPFFNDLKERFGKK
jgi:hypothetical protein